MVQYPYPDEPLWWSPVYMEALKADFKEAGRDVEQLPYKEWSELLRWFARGGYSCHEMSKEAALTKHQREWRIELGLPVPDPPTPSLPSLRVSGHFFTLADGTLWTMVECSDFNLLGRYMNGEDIRPILEQRKSCGYNTLRVFTAYDVVGIGALKPSDALYDAIPSFLDLCATYGFYVELVGFTGPYTTLFVNDAAKVQHWELLIWACSGLTNVLLELVNEGDHQANKDIPFSQLRQPPNVLCSHGSAMADHPPMQPVWSYSSYHSNGLSEWWRKTGHNSMEMGDTYGGPCTGNENTRFPDQDNSQTHASEAARAAALLCAGSCFHSVRGKTSELWDGQEWACAQAWSSGARSVDLTFQVGQYHHRTDLETAGVLRAYDRTLSNGQQFVVIIHQ
jgi:hypothetical protein